TGTPHRTVGAHPRRPRRPRGAAAVTPGRSAAVRTVVAPGGTGMGPVRTAATFDGPGLQRGLVQEGAQGGARPARAASRLLPPPRRRPRMEPDLRAPGVRAVSVRGPVRR